jgi:putative nucleotidyltransferase-like protein
MVDFIEMPEFPRRIAESLRCAAAPWPQSIGEDESRAIAAHGMLPLVYLLGGIPSLRQEALDAAVIEALRLADLREVLGVLGAAALIVKGTALAYSIYPTPELRPRLDTDLLIARGEIERVRRALTSIGFAETLTSGDELGVRQHSFSRQDRFEVTHIYDVHLDIANNAVVADALRYAELRARAVPLPAIAPDALGLCNADALLHACIHRVVHHHDSDRLIWLYDIHLLRERMTDEEHRQFWELAVERKVAAICMASVEAANRMFGGAVPPRLDVASDEPSSAFLNRHRRYSAVIAGDLAALPGWRARFKRLRQLAFPPPEFMMRSFGAPWRVLLPLLYAYRGFRGVTRMFRRIA